MKPGDEAAERAYREAFLAGAREAANWSKMDLDAVAAAWNERRRTRERSQVPIPSGQHLYLVGHEVDAARARGRVQALEAVNEAWEELRKAKVPDEIVRAFVLGPWVNEVGLWAGEPIAIDAFHAPPLPTQLLTEDQRRALAGLGPLVRPATAAETKRLLEPGLRSVHDLLVDFPHLRPPVLVGLLREGEILNVISSPKVGKSWLVTDLAIAVATGRPWLGLFDTHRGEVLILDNELHGATTASRIPQVALARGIPVDEFAHAVFVENVRGNLVDIFELEAYFNRIEPGRFTLIILDALYRFMPRDMDENANAAMASAYNQIDRYAQRLRSAFALVHHTTKGTQGDKSITDVGAGAGSQSRAADTHLILRPHEQDGIVVLDAAVRSWPPVEPRCLSGRSRCSSRLTNSIPPT